MIALPPEVLPNLIGEERVSRNDNIRDVSRHCYDWLLGIHDVIDSQRNLTSSVLEISVNPQSCKMGEAVNRPTVTSMVFLSFTFFMGLIGSNFIMIGDPHDFAG